MTQNFQSQEGLKQGLFFHRIPFIKMNFPTLCKMVKTTQLKTSSHEGDYSHSVSYVQGSSTHFLEAQKKFEFKTVDFNLYP